MTLPNEPQGPSIKEKKELSAEPLLGSKEKYPVVELPSVPEIPPEIEKVEAIGAEITLPQPVTDDTGAVVLDDTSSQSVSVSLPLTDEEIKVALHLKVVESLRWLAEWANRLLKKAGGKFLYRNK